MAPCTGPASPYASRTACRRSRSRQDSSGRYVDDVQAFLAALGQRVCRRLAVHRPVAAVGAGRRVARRVSGGDDDSVWIAGRGGPRVPRAEDEVAPDDDVALVALSIEAAVALLPVDDLDRALRIGDIDEPEASIGALDGHLAREREVGVEAALSRHGVVQWDLARREAERMHVLRVRERAHG